MGRPAGTVLQSGCAGAARGQQQVIPDQFDRLSPRGSWTVPESPLYLHTFYSIRTLTDSPNGFNVHLMSTLGGFHWEGGGVYTHFSNIQFLPKTTLKVKLFHSYRYSYMRTFTSLLKDFHTSCGSSATRSDHHPSSWRSSLTPPMFILSGPLSNLWLHSYRLWSICFSASSANFQSVFYHGSGPPPGPPLLLLLL